MTMKEILDWLIIVEEKACVIYGRSAKAFSDDLELSGFLMHLSDEERLHADIIKRASELTGGASDIAPPVYLDEDSRGR